MEEEGQPDRVDRLLVSVCLLLRSWRLFSRSPFFSRLPALVHSVAVLGLSRAEGRRWFQ